MHSEFKLTQVLLKSPDIRVSHISTDLFSRFDLIETIIVTVISDSNQTQYQLTKDNALVELD